jgi:hypothetical protein
MYFQNIMLLKMKINNSLLLWNAGYFTGIVNNFLKNSWIEKQRIGRKFPTIQRGLKEHSNEFSIRW